MLLERRGIFESPKIGGEGLFLRMLLERREIFESPKIVGGRGRSLFIPIRTTSLASVSRGVLVWLR